MTTVSVENSDLPEADILAKFQSFLASQSLVNLATFDAKLGTWTSPLLYAVCQGRQLVYLSERSTRHYQNASGDERCSGAIVGPDHSWGPGAHVSVQFEGNIVEATEGAALSEMFACYAARFPEVYDYYDDSRLFAPTTESSLCAITLREVKFLNEPYFGEESYVTIRWQD